MDNTKAIVITNEEQAHEILRSAIQKEIDGENINISFRGWPSLEIELDGPGYKSTITSDVAESLVSLQRALNRAYAAIVHNHETTRHLTDDEKAKLKFKAKVEDGCSLINIPLDGFAQVLTREVAGKMTGTELVVAVVGSAVAVGAGWVIKTYLQERTKGKSIDAETARAIAHSEQETARMKVFAEALTQDVRLRHAQAAFDESRTDILKSIADADSLSVNGIELPKKDVAVAMSTPRERATEVQLNGSYMVSEATFKAEDSTRVHLRRLQDGREFAATYQDNSIDQAQLQLLKDAAFEKRAVFLSINGTELRGQVTTAHIVAVSEQPKVVTKPKA